MLLHSSIRLAILNCKNPDIRLAHIASHTAHTTIASRLHHSETQMAQGKYTLYGCKGCGSTPVELVLEMHDLPYDYVDVEPWETSPNVAKLEQVNPLGQVPTLVTPQGAVLTESAGILLWLLQQTPASPPLPSDPVARASLYRWT